MSDLELVTVGTELLLGFTVDTNSAEIARALAALGMRVVRRTSVADDPDAIRDVVSAALRRTGVVLTTGGLGPTRDDITKKVIADLYGAPLDFDETVWVELVERFQRLGRVPSPSNRSQAEVPRGAEVLRNRWGTAPGLWMDGAPGLVIMLPGVPGEMRELLEHEVAPRLADRAGDKVIRSRVVRTTGIPESALAERLGQIERDVAPLTLAYLPGTEGVDLRLTAWRLSPEDAELRLAAAAARLKALAGEHAYGQGDESLAAAVLQAARQAGRRIAVAESCTGGLLGGRLTDVPGSSDVFVGGVVTYADAAKTALAGVPATLLEAHGAVSEPVAGALAAGAALRLGTDLAIAVTGVAGPGGGSAAKPIGTVCYGIFDRGKTVTRRMALVGDRSEIRARAVQAGLYLLWRQLSFSDS